MAMNPRLLRPLSRATQSRILYFNGAADGEWTELGNWWTDDTFTTPAASLPTSSDDVIATAAISSNSGSEPTVANFTLNDPNADALELSISITVTGMATFNGGSGNSSGLNGDATFNDAINSNIGTVNGDAVFNGSSPNDGTVTGNAVFNDVSYNDGTVNGTATFTGSACNDGGTAGAFVPDPPPSCTPAGLSLWRAETFEPVYHWSL